MNGRSYWFDAREGATRGGDPRRRRGGDLSREGGLGMMGAQVDRRPRNGVSLKSVECGGEHSCFLAERRQ